MVLICAALIRSAWASLLSQLLSGEAIPVPNLIGACRSFMSLGQILDFHSLPQSFKLHVILAIFISVAMTATSAPFRYESLGVAGVNSAVGPT